MGTSLSWLAVRARSPEELLSESGLIATGRRQEFPVSELVWASLPGGWTLFVADDPQAYGDEVLALLMSRRAEAVVCVVEEHSMMSMAAGWKDGREAWTVMYDGSN